jgi:hypothetical protein
LALPESAAIRMMGGIAPAPEQGGEMHQARGLNIPLSLPRRLICDMLHFAHFVPSVPVQRRMQLADLVAARAASDPRPSWCGIFTKAYAIVTDANPILRRAYLTFPWPHLYQHPTNIATIVIERRLRDEDAVFFVHLSHPETRSLFEIDATLRRYKELPLDQVSAIRRALRTTRWPLPVRRFLWWFALNVSGAKRAHFFGTSGISVYAGLGASSLHPLSVLTSTLNYGVIDTDGGVDVRLVYDHRVLDGSTVARALADLERVLHQEILSEVRGRHVAAVA